MPKIKKNVINKMVNEMISSSIEPDSDMKIKGNDMYWYPTYYKQNDNDTDIKQVDILESIL